MAHVAPQGHLPPGLSSLLHIEHRISEYLGSLRDPINGIAGRLAKEQLYGISNVHFALSLIAGFVGGARARRK